MPYIDKFDSARKAVRRKSKEKRRKKEKSYLIFIWKSNNSIDRCNFIHTKETSSHILFLVFFSSLGTWVLSVDDALRIVSINKNWFSLCSMPTKKCLPLWTWHTLSWSIFRNLRAINNRNKSSIFSSTTDQSSNGKFFINQRIFTSVEH